MKRWMLAGLAAAAMAGAVAAEDLVEVKAAGRLVARYQPAGVPMKPYVKELFSPAGVNVTVDSPPDHFHHHGLMFAIGAGEIDFWTEKPFERFGKQLPRAGATGSADGGVTQTIDWTSPSGSTLLVESRTLRAIPAEGVNLLRWSTSLAAAGERAVKLWGRHYFGLGIRFPADMDAQASFLLPDGAEPGRVVRNDEAVRAADWCAAAGTIGGRPVTVAIWDDPQNARRARWFTMSRPFSYLSATLNLEQESLTVEAGRPLTLSYTVAVWDGAVSAAQVERVRRSSQASPR